MNRGKLINGGYLLTSGKSFRFYSVYLSSIELKKIAENFSDFDEIVKNNDGSILVRVSSNKKLNKTIKELSLLLENKSSIMLN
ncbi:MAG: hypothetical protein HYT09_03890 [Candidatus Levybacteria bacterium]|nr:hypothetical protein [Candidatus Levybacteria bacterium]